jgi:hypothetical protein
MPSAPSFALPGAPADRSSSVGWFGEGRVAAKHRAIPPLRLHPDQNPPPTPTVPTNPKNHPRIGTIHADICPK